MAEVRTITLDGLPVQVAFRVQPRCSVPSQGSEAFELLIVLFHIRGCAREWPGISALLPEHSLDCRFIRDGVLQST